MDVGEGALAPKNAFRQHAMLHQKQQKEAIDNKYALRTERINGALNDGVAL